jgi:hypothetical protein
MSSIGNCDVCGIKASRLCGCCKKNFCGKKHLKSHKSSCFPSTAGLSTGEIERIENLANDMEEASLETFCETLKDMLQWEQWDREAQGGRLIRMARNSVFVRTGGGPAFVRALEKHHVQLCETDNVRVMETLGGLAHVSVDVLSSMVEADVCTVVVKCIRTCQFNDVCQRIGYRREICGMFHSWLLQMSGSTVLRKELIKSGAIKIIIQWLEEGITGGETISTEKQILNKQAKKEGVNFLYKFIEHNFACKTMLVETGVLQAVAAVIRENWGVAVIQLACKEFLESMYCRCQHCTESKFCNLCGGKAQFACPCSTVRYCSKECQQKDWNSHETLCKDSRHITETKIVENSSDEYFLLKETGTIDPDDESRCGIDVVERLRSASSVNDIMRWLLVLSRVPYDEMLQSKGFAAIVHVMLKYEDVAEIQSRGCAVFMLFYQQEGVSYIDTVIAVHKAGGHRTILKAMKNHPYDTKLQGCACNALLGWTAMRNSDKRCDMHSAHAIIGAMLRHKDDFSIQEAGCGALWNLASSHPEDKKVLVMAGAARVVAAASERYWAVSVEVDNRAKEFFNALFKEGFSLSEDNGVAVNILF